MFFLVQHHALHSRQDCKIDMVVNGESLQTPNKQSVSERGLFTAHGFICLCRTRKSLRGTRRVVRSQIWGLPWQSSSWDLALWLPGPRFNPCLGSLRSHKPCSKAKENRRANLKIRLWTSLPGSASFLYILAAPSSFVSTVFCLYPSRHKRHDPSWVCVSAIYDAFRLPNTIHLAMKENSFVLLPSVCGKLHFWWAKLLAFFTWQVENMSWRPWPQVKNLRNPVPHLPQSFEGETAPIPVVLWAMFVICWFSLANTYTHNYSCKRTLY